MQRLIAKKSSNFSKLCQLCSVYQHDPGCPPRPSDQVYRPLQTRHMVSDDVTIIVGNSPLPRKQVRRSPSVLKVHVDRHVATVGPQLVFGCHNIRSVASKLDDCWRFAATYESTCCASSRYGTTLTRSASVACALTASRSSTDRVHGRMPAPIACRRTMSASSLLLAFD